MRPDRDFDELLEEVRASYRRDALSALANQKAFYSDASRPLSKRKRPVFVAVMDINNFKQHNSKGLEHGDSVISAIGAEVSTFCSLTGAEGYRIGGDEFFIAFYPLSSTLRRELRSLGFDAKSTDYDIGRELMDSHFEEIGTINRPVMVKEENVPVSLSIGISEVLKTDENLHGPKQRADLALILAKSSGSRGHKLVVYDGQSALPTEHEFRQTCLECGTGVKLVIPSSMMSEAPANPQCPVCTRPLTAMGIETFRSNSKALFSN